MEKVKEKIIDERTGIEYKLVDNYYLPNIKNIKQEKLILNKYGRLRLEFLKKNKKGQYISMLIEGTLNDHLKEVQNISDRRVNDIIEELKEKSNLTEDMKDNDMLNWVGTMNAIKNQAEEIVLNEILYV